jgi:hypothetical protein
MVPLLVATLAAFVGCATFQRVLASLGFHLEISSAAYTTTALVAVSNPLLAIFGVMMLPVPPHPFLPPYPPIQHTHPKTSRALFADHHAV